MITVYTTSSCAFCPMAKKFLQIKNLPFTEVDITNDSAMRGKLFEKTGMMTVPVTTDGEKWVVGYNPGLLAQFA